MVHILAGIHTESSPENDHVSFTFTGSPPQPRHQRAGNSLMLTFPDTDLGHNATTPPTGTLPTVASVRIQSHTHGQVRVAITLTHPHTPARIHTTGHAVVITLAHQHTQTPSPATRPPPTPSEH